MLRLTAKAGLAEAAQTLALSYHLVQHKTATYIPMDVVTGEIGPTTEDRQIWVPISRDEKRRLGNDQFQILFANDSEITNFDLMIRQCSIFDDTEVDHILVKTKNGMRSLGSDGKLTAPDGTFTPTYIEYELNEDPALKAEVFGYIKEWLSSEEEAHSLLNHLATALCPSWSAVKYVLFIGEGRNGKSLLLRMVLALFGKKNVSHVTRQQIAERLPVVAELNDKICNIVIDGAQTYIKDSSMEKTLVAGEPAVVRMLFENGNSVVQTTALFLEGLNKEPKTRDKSTALQKRISRFWFNNIYPLDRAFERKLLSPDVLGAFLSLLIDHFVLEDEIAEKLKQTEVGKQLQAEMQLLNSPLLQFIQYLYRNDPSIIDKLSSGGQLLDPLVASFMAWRVGEGHTEFTTVGTQALFKEGFRTERKSVRENGKVVKRTVLGEPRSDVQAFLEEIKGGIDAEDFSTLVERIEL